MQAALRQRHSLQEAFDWLGWPGSVSVSARNSRCERGSGTNSGASNSSTSSYGADEDDSSAYLETACSSSGRNGTKRGTPAETMPDAAAQTTTAEKVAAAISAERGAAQADTGARTTLQLQVEVTEKQRSTDYFRLINSAGDLLPGVVIDLYGEYASIQLLTCGIDFLLPLIVEALQRLLQLRGIVVRLEHPDRLLEHPQQQLRQQHAFEKPPPGRRRDGDAASGEGRMDVDREECTSSTSRADGPLNYLRYCLGEHFAVPSQLPPDLRCLSFGKRHRHQKQLGSLTAKTGSSAGGAAGKKLERSTRTARQVYSKEPNTGTQREKVAVIQTMLHTLLCPRPLHIPQ
eukprot:XP_028343339.1 uncharacterized protein LOC114485733 [Physeter catodon]